MRKSLIGLCIWVAVLSPAVAQWSVGIGMPGVQIDIRLAGYPELVAVPGYPVYYAPRLDANFFFYDGMYWVYERDLWYASTWYDGPWDEVGPGEVPVFLLRVPVRYYRAPPQYFRPWRIDTAPRWGEHWGRQWEQQRSGWDRWDRRAVPAPAPLPTYQRRYAGDRYPQRAAQQQELRSNNYRYQPRDPGVRQHLEPQQAAPNRDRPVENRGRPPAAAAPPRASPNRPVAAPPGPPVAEDRRRQPQPQAQRQPRAQAEVQAPRATARPPQPAASRPGGSARGREPAQVDQPRGENNNGRDNREERVPPGRR